MRTFILMMVVLIGLISTNSCAQDIRFKASPTDKEMHQAAAEIARILSGRQYDEELYNNKPFLERLTSKKEKKEYRIIKWGKGQIINIGTVGDKNLPSRLFMDEDRISKKLGNFIKYVNDITKLNVHINKEKESVTVEVFGLSAGGYITKAEMQEFWDKKEVLLKINNNITKNLAFKPINLRQYGSTSKFLLLYDNKYSITFAAIYISSGTTGGVVSPVAVSDIRDEELQFFLDEGILWVLGIRANFSKIRHIKNIKITPALLLQYLYLPQLLPGMDEQDAKNIIYNQLKEQFQ